MIAPLRYHVLLYRKEQLWLPAGFWALFVLVAAFMRGDARAADLTTGFLSVVVPLIAGILAASVVVDDPALELEMASRRPAWWIMVERLALLLGIVGVLALAYQLAAAALGVSLANLGSVTERQLVWLVPSLTMMGLGSAGALVFANGTGGAMLVGLVWITEVMLRDWFAASEWARYLYLYMAGLAPQHPDLRANQASLTLLAVTLVFGATVLLRKEERYL